MDGKAESAGFSDVFGEVCGCEIERMAAEVDVAVRRTAARQHRAEFNAVVEGCENARVAGDAAAEMRVFIVDMAADVIMVVRRVFRSRDVFGFRAVARRFHAERTENELACQFIERTSRNFFENGLQNDVAHAAVVHSFADAADRFAVENRGDGFVRGNSH